MADITGVTPPRLIYAGQFCFVTVRAVNRCFRFAPARQTLEVIWYCLACTLDKFRGRIAAHEFLWMSNHYHLVLTDEVGCLPRFMEELNSLLARALNALQGLQGSAIEKGYNLVAVTTDNKLVEHCVYTLANPSRADIVERSHDWQGVSSRHLDYGVAIKVARPAIGMWSGCPRPGEGRGSRSQSGGRSKLPDEVELVLVRPSILPRLSDDQLRSLVLGRLDERERQRSSDRRSSGIRVMGWRAATKVSFRSIPKNDPERLRRIPHYSGDSREDRVLANQRRKSFLERYYDALCRFVSGDRAAEFPAGTWLMRVRFGANCCAMAET